MATDAPLDWLPPPPEGGRLPRLWSDSGLSVAFALIDVFSPPREDFFPGAGTPAYMQKG